MQAIQTKFHPCTDAKDARIKASCERGSITVPCPYGLSGDLCHRVAVDASIAKFVKEDAKRYGTQRNPWQSPYVTGALPDGTYVHVFV